MPAFLSDPTILRSTRPTVTARSAPAPAPFTIEATVVDPSKTSGLSTTEKVVGGGIVLAVLYKVFGSK